MDSENIEDIYRLTPTQQGMLFHTLESPRPGIYCEQFGRHIKRFDPKKFEQAWQLVQNRHPVLRSSFHWEQVQQPVQIVWKEVVAVITHHDISHMDENSQASEIDRIINQDRLCGFDLTKPPLTRLKLIRTSSSSWYVNWIYHHMILDGWSTYIVLEEILTVYDALLQGKSYQLPQRRAYRDYVTWINHCDHNASHDYWLSRLQDIDSATTLPLDQGADCSTHRYENFERVSLLLPKDEGDQVSQYLKSNRLTLNTLVQGIWSFLLYEYSGEDSTVHGNVISGRPHELQGSDSMVGLFINTLPVRIDIRAFDRVVDWLRSIQSMLAEMRVHESTPLSQIHKWSNIENGKPLFDSLVAVETYPVSSNNLDDFDQRRMQDLDVFQRTNYALTLWVEPGEHIALALAYDPERFSSESIQRLLQQFRRVLLQVVQEKVDRVFQLSVLSRAEKKFLLKRQSWKDAEVCKDNAVHVAFEQAAEQYAERVALCYGDTALSYRELNAKANQLAVYLRDRGIGNGDFVGIGMHRSHHLIIAMLATLKAGGAYVPVDPEYPRDRILYLLQDADVKLVLTDSGFDKSMGDIIDNAFEVDRQWSDIKNNSDSNLSHTVSNNQPVYTIYTSGSTGSPKGATVYHHGFMNLLRWYIEETNLDPQDNVLLISSHSFDLTQKNIFAPLITGAELILQHGVYDPQSIIQSISDHEVTLINCTPSSFYPIIDDGSYGLIASLKYVVLGGEPIAVSRLLEWQQSASCQACIINSYGPTECTDVIASFRVEDLERFVNAPIPIGKPIQNVVIYLLNRYLQPVPIGVRGEIYISGIAVGQGYYNDGAKTAASFIPDPYSNIPGSRMYRTGDIGRYNENGEIEFLGRADFQVKIRGFRIELGEIESELEKGEWVRDAVVDVRQIDETDKRLVAWLTVKQGANADLESLRGQIRETIPDYMYPSIWVILDELPLTPSGKIDRKALPEPNSDDFQTSDQHIEPQGKVETLLHGLWCEVLNCERVSVTDNFFYLGGDSILSIQLISRARKLGLKITPRQVFTHPTISELASFISSAEDEQESIEICLTRNQAERLEQLDRTLYEDAFPLSPAQQGMLFHSQYDKNSADYFTQFTLSLAGDLDVEVFQQAWQEVISHHDSLRVDFDWSDLDQPLQRVAKQVKLPWRVEDWSSHGKEFEADYFMFLKQDREQGFNLSQAPLMRMSLFRSSAGGYEFIWSYHHILLDGWSLTILLKQLFDTYRALLQGVKVVQPESVPYRDFIGWLQHQDRGAAESFWKSKLQGFDSPVSLGLPQTGGREHGMVQRILPRKLSQSLRSLAAANGLTLNTLVQGAWAMLIARHGGQKDVVYGYVVSGRPESQENIEHSIGLFLNTIPVCLQIDESQTVQQWLNGVQDNLVEFAQYQHTSLSDIQSWSEIPPGKPLFESIIAFENTPLDEELKTQAQQSNNLILEQTGYPISVKVFPDEQMTIQILHNDTVAGPTVDILLDHFEQLLWQIILKFHMPTKQVVMLTDDERKRILYEWNDTCVDYPDSRCIHQLFEEMVQSNPGSTALLFADQIISYDELNRRANRIAHHLHSLGVGPETLVGISVERSPQLIIGLLAILKAGAAYVPLDPDYPDERKAYMLEDSRIHTLLTSKKQSEKFSGYSLTVVLLDDDIETFSIYPDSNPCVACMADNTVYVVYTSGTTGMPKGVVASHRGVMRLVMETDYTILSSQETYLQLAPIAFDASTFEIWGALLNGARLAIMDPELPSVETIGAAIHRYGVSILWLTSGLFNQMVELNPQSMAGLKQVLTGGDVMSTNCLKTMLKELPQVKVVNLYGPTENTTFSTFYDITHYEWNAPVPIGKCIKNSTAYILNEALEPVPVCVSGELYVGGDGIARCYLNQPKLTAERFIPDPFSPVPGSRLYRTGDICRYLEDGNIEFIGRSDSQVKIRGYRIELAEIESILRLHPAVSESIVLVKTDGKGHKQLVAWAVLSDKGIISSNEIRRYLSERIPSYMVPTAIVLVDSFPINANGKIDQQALPDPQLSALTDNSELVEPRNEFERILCQVWESLLNLQDIGITDNYFELGGDSILTIQMVSVLHKKGIEISPKDVFDSQTIAELAKRIQETDAVGNVLEIQFSDDQKSFIEKIPESSAVSDVYPLSPVQQGMLFHSVFSRGSGMYINQFCMKLPPELDVTQFRAAWHYVINRHGSVKVGFVWEGLESPLQIEHKEVTIPWCVEDWSTFGPKHFDEQFKAFLETDRHTDFQMNQVPLMRMTLIRAWDGHYEFVWSHHHILLDGWSIPLVLSELHGTYQALLNRQTPIFDISPSFRDHVAWLQQQDMKKAEVFWKQRLAGFKVPTPLLFDSEGGNKHSNMMQWDFSEQLTADIENFARKHRLTVSTIIQGAWGILLARYSNERDVVFGTVVSGRSPKQGHSIDAVGLFLNTLPTRAVIEKDDTLVLWLQRFQQQQMEMREYEYTPLININVWSEIPQGSNLFESIVAFENTPIESWLAQEGEYAQTQIHELSSYPLTVKVYPGKSIKIQMIYSERFNSSTVGRMLHHLNNLIDDMVRCEDGIIDRLQMVVEPEKSMLIYDTNQTRINYPGSHCLHQLIEQQVRQTPDVIALVCESSQLTYLQLNSRANQLAHYLRKQGAGPEVKIGLCMERSIEMVVGLLGIIKSGAAYVPLDPEYPEERLQYMIEDAQAHLVLMQQHLVGYVKPNDCKVLCIDTCDEIMREPVSDPKNLNNDQNVAYVIYTSGSTGRPKGVMNTHRAISNRLVWMQDAYGLTEDDRILQKTSFSFDVSVWEFFWPLMTGAALVMAKPGGHKDAAYMAGLIRQQGVTTMHFVPPMLQMFLNVPSVSECNSLKRVICSGEALSHELVTKFHKTLDCKLHNLYGPTEAAIDVTAWDCSKMSDRNTIPIGFPIANTQIHILDRYLRPVPVGVVGELYIGGENLARGYFNRPALTAEKFIPNPFSDIPGERLYKTGDLARYLPDMSIQFIGRIDSQVKIRGFRIELGEIESVLLSHELIDECVLLARDDSFGGEKLLIAWVGTANPGMVNVGDLKIFLRASLPEYMVPADIVILESFPLTPNGKIDRNALPEPERSFDEEREYVAPRNETEQLIADIWEEVLGYDRVGMSDSFFDLGGHSMLMMRVNVRLNQMLEREIDLVKLFEYPTIESLSSYLLQGDDRETFWEKSDSEIQRRKTGTDRLVNRRVRMKRKGDTEKESYGEL